MALADAEVEAIRFHLGYGNVGVGAYPYTPDGFKELFDDVVAPNLTGSTETTATTAITADSTTEVMPVSMTGIVVRASLVIDIGDDAEIVAVRSATGTTFTAKFAKAHPASGYPISVMGGHARLRMLLHQADRAWEAIQNPSVGKVAGLKQVDKGDVEWFEGDHVLKGRVDHYKSIVWSISSLVRVLPRWANEGSRVTQLEAY